MNTPTSAAFSNPADTWNQRFAHDEFLFGTAPNAWLEAHSPSWPPASHLLSVADGEGRNSVWLAGLGHRVDAFDIAEVGVAKARRLAAQHQVSVNFAVADCDSFNWQEAVYEGVVAIFVQFADPELRQRLFSNMVRSLKPGGFLVLQGYTPKQLEYRTGGPPNLSHLYTEALLRDQFAALEIVLLQEYEAEIHEGSGHRGQSALIGMVARKR
ncbi:MAG: class I SAM-dependent methyltransferase [Rhodoferax sp.]|nr:class I SAM-dependent methyltransferase [Rhodoferax sp.]MCF8211479.1 class I SAM-dependent methyltransferase [Rhodoferax sp.]